MKKTVYCLGNGISEKDSLPLKIMPVLEKKFPGITFVSFDPTEAEVIKDDSIILDTVEGIEKVRIFYNLDHFARSPRNSVHDYDLPVFLGLMLKLKKIKRFIIIGVPENYPLKKSIEEAGVLLTVLGTVPT